MTSIDISPQDLQALRVFLRALATKRVSEHITLAMAACLVGPKAGAVNPLPTTVIETIAVTDAYRNYDQLLVGAEPCGDRLRLALTDRDVRFLENMLNDDLDMGPSMYSPEVEAILLKCRASAPRLKAILAAVATVSTNLPAAPGVN